MGHREGDVVDVGQSRVDGASGRLSKQGCDKRVGVEVLKDSRHPHPCLTAAAQTCRRRRARGDARSGPEGDIGVPDYFTRGLVLTNQRKRSWERLPAVMTFSSLPSKNHISGVNRAGAPNSHTYYNSPPRSGRAWSQLRYSVGSPRSYRHYTHRHHQHCHHRLTHHHLYKV